MASQIEAIIILPTGWPPSRPLPCTPTYPPLAGALEEELLGLVLASVDRPGAVEQCPTADSCHNAIMHPEIKRVGQSGQISIGRELAGKLLRLEQLEDGRLLLTPVVDVPESQLWTLREPHKSRIERGLAWAAATPAKETDVTAVVAKAKRRKNR
ncbi:MAG: hypothetical protein HYY06_10580 [Deltaproteobacteria bacterium]|nr:hypothetical protein [Deltaproteobacteria bacterium]